MEPEKIDVRAFDHVDAIYEDGCSRIDPKGLSSRCGASCNWAQNYSTDAYAHGLVHPIGLLREVQGFLT